MAATDERINFIADFELRGERQVERGVLGIGQAFLSAKSGADIASVALEKFGRIFEVGIGGALGAAGIGLVVSKLTAAGEKLNALVDSVDELTQKPLGRMDLSEMDSSIDDLQKKLKESGAEGAHSWWDTFKAGFQSMSYQMDQPIYKMFGIDLSAMSPEGEQKDRMTDRLTDVMNKLRALDKASADKVRQRSKEDQEFKYQQAVNEKPTGTSHINELNLEMDRNHVLAKRILDDMAELDDKNKYHFKNETERAEKKAKMEADLSDLLIARQGIQNELDKPHHFVATSIRAMGGAAGGGGSLKGGKAGSGFGFGNEVHLGIGGGHNSLTMGKSQLDTFFNSNTSATQKNTDVIQQNTEALRASMRSNNGGGNTTELLQ